MAKQRKNRTQLILSLLYSFGVFLTFIGVLIAIYQTAAPQLVNTYVLDENDLRIQIANKGWKNPGAIQVYALDYSTDIPVRIISNVSYGNEVDVILPIRSYIVNYTRIDDKTYVFNKTLRIPVLDLFNLQEGSLNYKITCDNCVKSYYGRAPADRKNITGCFIAGQGPQGFGPISLCQKVYEWNFKKLSSFK